MTTSTMDLLIKFEEEGLSASEEVQLFSGLIKGGLAWSLQGSYGRAARDYIDQGILSPEGEILIEIEDPEEDVEPCCLLWKEAYPQDHEYGCPRAVEARQAARCRCGHDAPAPGAYVFCPVHGNRT